MYDEELEDAMEQMDAYGTVQSTCTVCGAELTGEPDAFTLWCYRCKEVVPVNNPLAGMI